MTAVLEEGLATSVLEHVASLSDEEIAAWVGALKPGVLAEVQRREWWFVRRPDQKAPAGDWLIWLILTGRGWGKTRTGAEWLVEQMLANPVDVSDNPTEWIAVGETLLDGWNIQANGPSGILNVLKRRKIPFKAVRSPAPSIRLSTGQVVHISGADDADVGRGLNLAGAWLDEMAKWRMPALTWSEGLGPALRTRMPGGTKPQVVVTTTPKPIPLLFDWTKREDGSIVVTRGSTFDNAANLSSSAISEFIRQYGSSRTGRQELYAELLTDVEGAIWKVEWLNRTRVTKAEVPELVQIVVAMDPAISDAENADESGIVVVGKGVDGHDYVLADRSAKIVGIEAARACWEAYLDFEADYVVYESNQGMDWVRDVLRTAWNQLKAEGKVSGNAPLKSVNATRGKKLRAEPVAARYEANEVHHAGRFEKLETQMTEWLPTSNTSPDRLDALVHGVTFLRAGEVMDATAVSAVSMGESRGQDPTVHAGNAGLPFLLPGQRPGTRRGGW